MIKPHASVIIPALDEEPCVARAIASARGAEEVIVVDGGSRDRTRELDVDDAGPQEVRS